MFSDEPTTPYDPGSVPVAIEEDETRPVDAGELEVAARQSLEITEAFDPTSIPATRTSPNARPRPFVELLIAGAGRPGLALWGIAGFVLTLFFQRYVRGT